MQFPKNYIVFDTETTGLDSLSDKVIEIAAIKVVENQIVARFECLVNHKISISPKTTELTTITQTMVNLEGISPDAAIRNFAQFVNNAFPVIGHNIIRFDMPFLVKWWDHKIIKDLPERAIDTAAIYKAHKLAIPVPPEGFLKWATDLLEQRHYGVKYSIDTCCKELEIDKKAVTQHRAMGDVLLTNQIYRKMCLPVQAPLPMGEIIIG